MGFVNLEKMSGRYVEEPMKTNVEKLIDYDLFHCLLSGSMSTAIKVKETLGSLPQQFIDWLKVCDGGLLFDTVLLSTKEHDEELDLDFDTYEELNSEEAKSQFGLPEGYAVIGMRSYGDPICVNTSANDEKIYLWDVEAGDFSDIWCTFEDFLIEEIDEAEGLIAEDVLQPLGIKVGGGEDE